MTDTPDRPQPQPGILKIAPYVPGKSQAAPGVTPMTLDYTKAATRVEDVTGRLAGILGL